MTGELTICAAEVVTPSMVLRPGYLTIENGRFTRVTGSPPTQKGRQALDPAHCTLWPGLVDVHIHGARGLIAGQGQRGVVEAVSRALASQGVTRHVLSLPALPAQDLVNELGLLLGEIEESGGAAGVLGLHLEGPFLNPERAGAMPKNHVRKPDMAEFQRLADIAGSRLKMMTIAPELDGALEVIRAGVERGMVMAAGHSEASISEMDAAIGHGLRHVTHLFNAMRRFSHRSPGIMEAGLSDDRLTVEIICDGTHVHRKAVEILLRCRGLGSVILVSDSTAFEAPAGIISFLGRVFDIRRGLVRDTQTGALGGSASSLWQCLCKFADWTGLSMSEIAGVASLNPARLLGLDAEIGSIEEGKKADFFLCDKDRHVRQAYRDGMPIWHA